MNEYENFDPKTFEELTSLQEESEWEQNHPPEITEIDASGGELLDKPFANPLLKALLVITLVTSAVAIPAIIGATLVATFNNRKSNPRPKQASNLVEENDKEEIEKLKTAMAQIEIEDESKKLEEASKPKLKPTPKAEVPTPKQPEPVAEKTPRPQEPQTIAPEPTLIPAVSKPQPVVTQELPTPTYTPPAPPPPLEKQQVKPITPASRPITIQPKPTPVIEPKKQEKNPFEVREQLTQAGIGVYGANSAIPNPTIPVTATPQKPRTILASHPYPADSEAYIQRREEPNVLAGDEFKGRLKQTIVTTGRTIQKPVIKVTKDFKDVSGQKLIPKKSRIVTKIHSINNQGVVQLLPTSIIIQSKNKLVQKPIPRESMLILAKNGEPLIAKTKLKKLPRHKQNPPAEMVVATIPVNRSKTANKTVKSKSISPKKRNQILLRQRLRSSKNRVRNYRVFTLEKGTKVKVYVNKSFRL